MQIDSTGLMLWLISWGFLTAWVAAVKGYRTRSWFLLGVFMGPLATCILLFQPRRSEDPDAP